eukprot:SAG31_NODE_95_length_25901_cov_24.763700_21_plen_108_part_00
MTPLQIGMTDRPLFDACPGFLQIDFHGIKPAQAHADTTSIFVNAESYQHGWLGQRLRQHIDTVDTGRIGKTEYQWKSRKTGQLSGLAGGYPIAGTVSTVISNWDRDV